MCVIAEMIVFVILFFVGIFGLGASWGESLLSSTALTAVGVGGIQ